MGCSSGNKIEEPLSKAYSNNKNSAYIFQKEGLNDKSSFDLTIKNEPEIIIFSELIPKESLTDKDMERIIINIDRMIRELPATIYYKIIKTPSGTYGYLQKISCYSDINKCAEDYYMNPLFDELTSNFVECNAKEFICKEFFHKSEKMEEKVLQRDNPEVCIIIELEPLDCASSSKLTSKNIMYDLILKSRSFENECISFDLCSIRESNNIGIICVFASEKGYDEYNLESYVIDRWKVIEKLIKTKTIIKLVRVL